MYCYELLRKEVRGKRREKVKKKKNIVQQNTNLVRERMRWNMKNKKKKNDRSKWQNFDTIKINFIQCTLNAHKCMIMASK